MAEQALEKPVGIDHIVELLGDRNERDLVATIGCVLERTWRSVGAEVVVDRAPQAGVGCGIIRVESRRGIWFFGML